MRSLITAQSTQEQPNTFLPIALKAFCICYVYTFFGP